MGGPRPPGCRAASALSLLPQPCGAWGLRVWAEGGEVAGGACAARLAADCRGPGGQWPAAVPARRHGPRLQSCMFRAGLCHRCAWLQM